MTVELNREAIDRVAALPAVREAAETGARLIALWPLTEAMQMDNDAKYAENLQVRITRAFARILTGEDVTVPDAEFVYEGADEIPGRPQSIVDTLLAANDAYDTMLDYSETGNAALVFAAAEALGVEWDDGVRSEIRAAIDAVERHIEADAADEGAAGDESGDHLAGSADPAAVAHRFATALAVCDALLAVAAAHVPGVGDASGALDDVAARRVAAQSLPILLYVNELREQCAIPRICLTDGQLLELVKARVTAADTLEATAELIAPLAGAEWAKHREDVLWDPAEAKKKAKEEDEKRNKEALAAKFAHIKDDPTKETVEL
ncbi:MULTISPECIES: hypothetical protein [Bifidobacterium]|uniref:Uncharacterized protein n=1 Tax=Bifidobacterium myosotis TaxID=1630166 RepID=A0A261FKB0_9BIFI|nr:MULTISPECIES: hypothetical protein [Bifidobacterium]OZG59246.1 hypothetical protein BMYO_1451 [Bifidobacterium myosotis]TPF95655.1 hypothetical protein BG22_01355 [Bifidobacterium sp. UTBIF-78]